MKLTIVHQGQYSRGELLLRVLFGWLYIFLPHFFILMFLGIWSSILSFIAFFSIMFTGRYPQSFFEFQVGLTRWSIRVHARYYNLSDGYPVFGIDSREEYTDFQMAYPESLSKSTALIKLLFGWLYCTLPHTFIWLFRSFATTILCFIAFWVVLFTGEYPASWHKFNVGTIRWITRVNLYMGFMTDVYPPFSGKEINEESDLQEAEKTI